MIQIILSLDHGCLVLIMVQEGPFFLEKKKKTEYALIEEKKGERKENHNVNSKDTKRMPIPDTRRASRGIKRSRY